mgnify:CR=1 FL=1
MKEISYWDQFYSSGKVEDYLKFKEQSNRNTSSEGETLSAGFSSRNRDDYQGSAYR